MKSKLIRMFGVVVTVAVLVSMLVVATPASAGTLAWSSESSLPTSAGDTLDIAAAGNGTTIYAAVTQDFSSTIPGAQNLVKSTNGGATWTAVNTNTATGNTTAVSRVAVAPDVADGSWLAAIVTDSVVGQVMALSSDGGANWSFAPAIAGATSLTAVAVSRPIGTTRTIAVAANNGLWTVDLGGTFGGSWINASLLTGFVAGTVDAVAFSPNFAGDRTVAVVTDNGTNTIMQLFNKTSAAWNAPVYPAWVGGAAVAAVVPTHVSLALSPSFLGSDPASQVAYVTTGAALYRMSGTLAATLYTGAVYSVAVNAAGDKLVAGPADNTVAVLRVASPATAAATAVTPGTKRPGGPASTNTVVAFAGTTVVAAGAGVENAFAKSTDDGKTFVDISLVDTTFTPKDFVVSADGGKFYALSYSGTTLSVFRKATAWERVGAFNITSGVTSFMAHLAPDNGDVIFISEKASSTIYYSNDGGYTTWTTRYSPNMITDMAVESASIVYVLSGNFVSKSVDSGFIWDNPKTSVGSAVTGYSLTLVGTGNLLVGGTAGEVCYSTDANVSWTKMSVGSTAAGSILAAADKLATGGVIYTASATNVADVYRFTIGTSTTWTAMKASALSATAVGIGFNSGALYVVDAGSMLYRTISPATAASAGSWSSAAATEVTTTTTYALTFVSNHNGLAISVGADKFPKLWALSVGSRTNLESFTDILVATSPALTSPAERAAIQINTANGNANNVVLQWTGVANTPVGTTYTVQLSLDSAFTQVVSTTAGVANTMLILGPTGTTVYPFQSSTTYYWRVRVEGPFYSPYTAGRSFVIDALEPISIQSPAAGANNVPVKPTFVWQPVVGATTYEIVVSDDPTFKIITFSRTTDKAVFASDEALANSTVYYWRVRASAPATAVTPWVVGVFTTEAKPAPTTAPTATGPVITITQPAPTTITVEVPQSVEAIPAYLLWIIIGIGAILVIALIVLIVRTRRTG